MMIGEIEMTIDLNKKYEEMLIENSQLKEENSLRFAKFRQKMCDLLWENNCDHIGLSDEKNAALIFNIAHNICNELLKDYDISEKKK